jgi:2-polyprenyl-3-methyl-5-hydroxy-6-metoxy-1,4-benzoquinol methylase
MKIQTVRNRKYYDSVYKDSQTLRANELGVSLIKAAIGELPLASKARVLDVACGYGLLGKAMSDNVWGFDSSKVAVRIAKSMGIKATVGDAEKRWKYPNDYFDIVIASHIIEHVRNPDALLSEAHRVLKKGGKIILITPNLAAWFNRVILLLGFQPFFTEVSTIDKTLGLSFTRAMAQGVNPVGHLRVFTLGALIDLLKLHKWDIQKTAGMEFGSFPTILRLLDQCFSKFTPLSSSLIVIAQKKRD